MIELSPAQAQIVNSSKRFRTSVCGRRFGKTFVAICELMRHASEKDKNVWYVAPSYRQAKQIVWEQLKTMLKDYKWLEQSNEAELTLRLKSGSKITLKGAENKDGLRGVGLDFLVMDEYQDLDEELWKNVLRPTLSDKKGKALFIGTPKGIGSFSHTMYSMAKTTEDWEAFSFKTIDGGQVDQTELDDAKRDLDQRTYTQEYEATFLTYSGMVYYNFDRSEAVQSTSALDKLNIHCGMDFNYSPFSVAVSVIENNTVYFIDEISVNESSTEEICDELKRRYPNSRINIYPDSAGKQRRTSAGGKTDISILQNAGFRVFFKNANPPIRDRVNAVNSKLKNSKGIRSVFIDPKCKQIIKSLESLQYKENTSLVENNQNTHMSDAVGYLIDYLYPVKKEVEFTQPTRWSFSRPIPGVR